MSIHPPPASFPLGLPGQGSGAGRHCWLPGTSSATPCMPVSTRRAVPAPSGAHRPLAELGHRRGTNSLWADMAKAKPRGEARAAYTKGLSPWRAHCWQKLVPVQSWPLHWHILGAFRERLGLDVGSRASSALAPHVPGALKGCGVFAPPEGNTQQEQKFLSAVPQVGSLSEKYGRRRVQPNQPGEGTARLPKGRDRGLGGASPPDPLPRFSVCRGARRPPVWAQGRPPGLKKGERSGTFLASSWPVGVTVASTYSPASLKVALSMPSFPDAGDHPSLFQEYGCH